MPSNGSLRRILRCRERSSIVGLYALIVVLIFSQVVLIQVALSTSEENELQGGVIDLVGRINSRFSSLTYQPIVFLHTDEVTFSQYLALLTVADAFLVTSLREGMALR